MGHKQNNWIIHFYQVYLTSVVHNNLFKKKMHHQSSRWVDMQFAILLVLLQFTFLSLNTPIEVKLVILNVPEEK